MVLVHMYPAELTASQVSYLAGYSAKSKYIFKTNALGDLEQESIIQIKRPTKRFMLIQIHPENLILQKFARICREHGDSVHEYLNARLEEMS